MPSITCPVCGRSRSDKVDRCVFCEIAKDSGSTLSGLSEYSRPVESHQQCQENESSAVTSREEKKQRKKEPVSRPLRTGYHVVYCDGPTSLAQAIRSVENEMKQYLEAGWKPHGSISIAGWYEGDVARYAAAQALTMDEQ